MVTIVEGTGRGTDHLWPLVEHVEDVDYAGEFGLPLPEMPPAVAGLLGIAL